MKRSWADPSRRVCWIWRGQAAAELASGCSLLHERVAGRDLAKEKETRSDPDALDICSLVARAHGHSSFRVLVLAAY